MSKSAKKEKDGNNLNASAQGPRNLSEGERWSDAERTRPGHDIIQAVARRLTPTLGANILSCKTPIKSTDAGNPLHRILNSFL